MIIIRLFALLCFGTAPLMSAGCINSTISENRNDVAEIVKKIDDSPDPLHRELTPAAHRLIKIGQAALPSVIPLLASDNSDTRIHAACVLSCVTEEMCGHELGTSRTDEEWSKWKALWERMGDYRTDSLPERRTECVRRWTAWVNDPNPSL
jgi:hypothetical protein